MDFTLNVKFLSAISILMTYPLTSAYFQALRIAEISTREHLAFSIMAMFTMLLGFNFGFTLISQIDNNTMSIIDFFAIVTVFLLARIIHRKAPAFFLKLFLTKKK
jgi:hypothetical protein